MAGPENNPQDASKAAQKDAGVIYKWPLEYMKKENFKKGDILFKAGDSADKMFYIHKGSLRLVEINKIINSGQIIGEMGIFSPLKSRTASAVCEEDLEAYTMGRDEVINFFGRDPNLAINLIQLSIKRFIENLKTETEARAKITSELRIASEIQVSMLPRSFPKSDKFNLYAMMDPAKEVGGDFYDFFFINENKFCIVIGDVSGKGVPAALFMAITKTLFKTEAMLGLAPHEIVSRVNNIICPDNQMCMFVTVLCLILDIRSGKIEYCNAGHNPPLLCSGNVCFEFVKVPKGFVVGAMENTLCETKDLKMKTGDTLFLYTDGVTEAMNVKDELFSEARLNEALTKFKDQDVEKIVQSMRQEVARHAVGAPQSDDITMIALKYQGKGE